MAPKASTQLGKSSAPPERSHLQVIWAGASSHSQRTSSMKLRSVRPGEKGQHLKVSLSILGEAVQPQPQPKPYGWKLGHTHLVMKWFFARKGTAKPHFSINTFPSLSHPHFLSSMVAHVDGGLSEGWGLTQKQGGVLAWDTSLIIVAMLTLLL